MRRKHNETAVQAAERHIKELRAAAGLFPVICKACRAFDGKIYNKRFDTAIQAATEHVYTQKRNDHLEVYVYTESGDCITLLNIAIPADKRIKAADFIQAAENKRNELLQEAFHIEQVIPTIDTRKKQIEHIKHLLEITLADLSYTEKDLFELDYSIRRHY